MYIPYPGSCSLPGTHTATRSTPPPSPVNRGASRRHRKSSASALWSILTALPRLQPLSRPARQSVAFETPEPPRPGTERPISAAGRPCRFSSSRQCADHVACPLRKGWMAAVRLVSPQAQSRHWGLFGGQNVQAPPYPSVAIVSGMAPSSTHFSRKPFGASRG